ncbi:hypothetical protein B0H16DRAFT_1703912 [Mycena metata]|uniref:Uncharacterized protein n=1 Tax=Mycena metata TaxID=1033252 RepID=A0AAD7H0K6_9AGAR|nr:hypothetical protein B0H16DRAFT_1703912 [Mycena metata]
MATCVTQNAGLVQEKVDTITSQVAVIVTGIKHKDIFPRLNRGAWKFSDKEAKFFAMQLAKCVDDNLILPGTTDRLAQELRIAFLIEDRFSSKLMATFEFQSKGSWVAQIPTKKNGLFAEPISIQSRVQLICFSFSQAAGCERVEGFCSKRRSLEDILLQGCWMLRINNTPYARI